MSRTLRDAEVKTLSLTLVVGPSRKKYRVAISPITGLGATAWFLIFSFPGVGLSVTVAVLEPIAVGVGEAEGVAVSGTVRLDVGVAVSEGRAVVDPDGVAVIEFVGVALNVCVFE